MFKSLDKMEAVSREYLWGTNKEGRNKIPLIAWREIQGRKERGGVGLTDFRSTSRAMRMRQVAKLFKNPEEDWTSAADLLIRSVNARGRAAREREAWSLQEILLLQNPTRIPGAPTTTGLLDVWKLMREKLQIYRDNAFMPNTEVNKILPLMEKQGWIDSDSHNLCTQTLRREKLHTLIEWKDWCTTSEEAANSNTGVIGKSLTMSIRERRQIPELNWYWQPNSKTFEGWDQPTKVWRALLGRKGVDTIRLNRKWCRQENERQWGKRFKRIWRSPLLHKEKIWLWRLLQHGLSTMERTRRFGHGDGRCCRCRIGTESLEHLLIDCPASQELWNTWQRHTAGGRLEWSTTNEFITMLDEALRQRTWAMTFCLTRICWLLWIDRNQATFTDTITATPILVAVKQARAIMESLASGIRDEVKSKRKFTEAISDLESTFQLAGSEVTQNEIEETQSMRTESQRNVANSRRADMAAAEMNFSDPEVLCSNPATRLDLDCGDSDWAPRVSRVYPVCRQRAGNGPLLRIPVTGHWPDLYFSIAGWFSPEPFNTYTG
ncbi:hypothetical protein R1sor_012822 [Riccia sorocarpa]|uniref:Reverse transcriptase zinc-binding domain-containing protein n=1 Tax=Riccia sorocarpa TaxID=122646 RepID=A0ABD3I602_9MARC